MNYFDIFITVPVLWGIIKGFKKGLIVEVASLVALLLGLYASINFSFYAQQYIQSNFPQITSTYLPLVSFGITFLLVAIVIHLLAKVIEKMVNMVALGLINKILGSVFGGIKYILIVTIILLIFDFVIVKNGFISTDKISDSMFYTPITQVGKQVLGFLKLNEKIIINWIK